MPIFDTGYGALVTAATALDDDDSLLGAVDGGVRRLGLSAVRGCVFTAANTGTAYTATRTILNEDFLLTVTGNATITLAGGSIPGEMSVWNIIFKQDATGGRAVVVSSVVWVGGTPTFTTTTLASNHCMFLQHGAGTIWGYFGGAAAS